MRAGAVEIAEEGDQEKQKGKQRQQEIIRQLRGAPEDFILFRPSPNAPEKVFRYQTASQRRFRAAISPSFRCGSSEFG